MELAVNVLIWIIAAAVVAAGLAASLLVTRGTQLLASGRRLLVHRAERSLRDLFIFLDPGKAYVAIALVTVCAALCIAWLLQSAATGIGVGVLLSLLPLALVRWLQYRRRELLERQLPDALIMLAGALRAGASLASALGQLAEQMPPPLGAELLLVMRQQRLGVAIDIALERLAERNRQESMALTVSSMRIAHASGGNLAEALEQVSVTLRAQSALRGKIRALTAQGRLQAVIVGALPGVLFIALYKLEPQAMSLLFSTRAGWATLCAVGVLELSGALLLRRIVSIDL
jgi:tight adherence protein B